jgi:hypothetical protein
MKKLIAVVLFLALGVAHANSNVSIAITIGQWLLKNQNQSFYIQVEAQGANDNEARRNGFVLAVDQAVGTLILSERESDKKQLIKNDVYNYSSGYVTDYKILSKSTRGNNSVMVMDIWVSHSASNHNNGHKSRTDSQHSSDSSLSHLINHAQILTCRKPKPGSS